MRPRAVRVEGFSAYRRPVEVDFTGVEFFSISGATGAGKSSLVDAMVFALYGRVPRLGGGAVGPAISAGADRARVAFDFEAGGTRYTAVRLAQRTERGGATVKEARLEKGDEVIASGSKDVTAAVEDLLRLRFEDFTRTVVLPQGEFARFLRAAGSERQELLRNLLKLEIYTRMRGLARDRQLAARGRAEAAGTRLGGLDVPDDEAMGSARERVEALEALAERIADEERRLADKEATARQSDELVGRLKDRLERLDGLSPPDGLEELDAAASAARQAATEADAALGAAEAEAARLNRAVALLPTPDAVKATKGEYERLSEVERRIASIDVAAAAEAVRDSESALERAKTQAAEAGAALERERSAHAAHELTMTLAVGEPCPVCDREVADLPDREPPSDLIELEEAKSVAVKADGEAMRAAERARADLAALEARRAELEAARLELEGGLAEAPSLDYLDMAEKRHALLASQLAEADAALDRSKAARDQTRSELEDRSEAVRSVRPGYTAARDKVADADPPLPGSDDPIDQWKELMAWRDDKRAETSGEFDSAVESAESARSVADDARTAIVERLRAEGAPVEAPFVVGATRELEVAKAAAAQAEKALSEHKRLSAQVKESKREAEVAKALAGHLRTDGFERWLVAGAVGELVAGANGKLGLLSNEGYSLHSDDQGRFSIVDHHNADERRSVATLSGGETFLVSLALALALAETLAERGGADLDAIVIDEGFGALDDESLDTAASVLEDLAGDVMVGVITHVKELASRAPARFEVTRGPDGSTVSAPA